MCFLKVWHSGVANASVADNTLMTDGRPYLGLKGVALKVSSHRL